MPVHDETGKKMIPVRRLIQDLEYGMWNIQVIGAVTPVGVERPTCMAVKAVAFHGLVYRVRFLCRSP